MKGLSGFLFSSALIGATDESPVTDSRDVLPVLQKSCQAGMP